MVATIFALNWSFSPSLYLRSSLIGWGWCRRQDWSPALTQGIVGVLYLGLAGIILYLPYQAMLPRYVAYFSLSFSA